MKVFCIDSSNSGSIIKLEIGEWYEVIRDADENSYYIKQNNSIDWFYKTRFKTLGEMREEKLNRLLR